MKNLLLTFGFIVALCGVSYGTFYALCRDSTEVRRAMQDGDSMEWLRVEFHLTDEQYATIKRMHDDYYVECSVHCAAIIEAQEEGESEARVSELESICENAMEQHCRAVAATMNSDDGARYLAVVLPRIQGYDHHRAPNLQISH